jgi:transcriptional regulator with XRE-family HTH domain
MPKGSGRKSGSFAYNPIDVHVGSRLRTRRTLLGLSQTAVADAMGLTFQQLQKYEHGANRISASRLYDLSRILDVDMDYFFDEIDRATQKASPAQISQGKAKSSARKPPKSKNPMHKRETMELVRAYYGITDPRIRAHFRKLVQSTAASEGSS